MKLSPKQTAITVSVVTHVALAIGLMVWYLPERPSRSAGHPAAVQGQDAGDGESNQPTPPPKPRPPVPASVPADVSDQEIRRSFQSQMESVARLSDDEKQSELEKNLKRLESIADPKSVDDLSGRVAQSLGLDPQQYAPKTPPAEGDFQTETAQLQDVVRRRDPAGDWEYETRLVDADGRQMRVPVSAAEGQQLYETFQLMKQYPMADGIYRSVVMPMIQRMLQAESTMKRMHRSAQQIAESNAESESAPNPKPTGTDKADETETP